MAASRKSRAPASPYGPGGDWQAEQDLKTLIEAEKIKADKPRLRAAMKCKRELDKALRKV